MDEMDRASQLSEFYLGVALQQRQTKPLIPYSGFCLNCNEPFFLCQVPRRWCDSDCRDDWEKRGRNWVKR